MTELSTRLIVLGIGILSMAMFIFAILFTIDNGGKILHGFTGYTAEYKAIAGTDALINNKELDGATLYKLLDTNRGSISDYNIIKKDGTYIRDFMELLSTPNVMYSVKKLDGSVNGGLILEMNEIGVR